MPDVRRRSVKGVYFQAAGYILSALNVCPGNIGCGANHHFITAPNRNAAVLDFSCMLPAQGDCVGNSRRGEEVPWTLLWFVLFLFFLSLLPAF
jgi:hypothetical protein